MLPVVAVEFNEFTGREEKNIFAIAQHRNLARTHQLKINTI